MNHKQWGPSTTPTYTMPGEYARYLERNKMKPGVMYQLPIKCWIVVNGRVKKIDVVRIRGASFEYVGHDYADYFNESGNLQSVTTFYLFPVKRHYKPSLEMISDIYGKFEQWVARLKEKYVRPFE